MALQSMNDIRKGQPLNQDTEIARFNSTAMNRRLFSGDFRELGINPSQEVPYPLRINWFRRVSTFYPEMMFAERPIVTIENNERARSIEPIATQFAGCKRV